LTPPTGTNAGDSTLLAGTSSGASVLRTNGSPAFIPGKGFYLGVQNTNDTSLGFVFGVDFDIASLVTLQNGVPYAGDPSPANALDHYRYTVSTNALRAQFEINGPTGDVTLLARRGPTPASPTAYDYLSANPGTNDELIVVYDYSRPVPLSAGDWFLTVVNLSAAPVTYSVMATESPAYGTNILITDSSVSSNVFCISWSSLPGAHYYLQGKNEIDDTNWVTISPTLTASDLITSYCVPLTAPLNFFRIEEGLVITPPPLVIGSVSYNSTGVLLRWQAPTNQQFQVEWTASIDLPHWSAFTNVITSSSDSFSFLDDGSQSGSFTQTRYYRLRRWP